MQFFKLLPFCCMIIQPLLAMELDTASGSSDEDIELASKLSSELDSLTKIPLESPKSSFKIQKAESESECSKRLKKCRGPCCGCGCFLLIILGAVGLGSLTRPPDYKPVVTACAPPKTEVGSHCWIARLEKCGSCAPIESLPGCPAPINVDGLYSRLNDSAKPVCINGYKCVDLFTCGSKACISDSTEIFDHMGKQVAKCKTD